MKRISCIVLCFFLLASGRGESENVFNAGKQAYESGNYSRALDLFARSANSSSTRTLSFYYQGLVLYELGLYYSSYRSFRKVLLTADGKNNQVYEKAIKNVVIITDRLKMVELAGSVLAKVPSNLVPSSVSDMNHYAQGVYYFWKQNRARALSHLKSVHPGSQFYLKSLFHIGVLATQRKDYKEAAFHFKKIMNLTRGKKRYFDIAELARLNLARVVYAGGALETSISLYSRFLSSSPHWLTVLFEASWPLMRVNDTTVSLGNLHTILSPFYQEDMVGEGYILRATILYTLCKYEEMRTTLAQFFKIYDPVMRSMQAERSSIKSSESFYTAYTEKKGLNSAFVNYVERDQGIQNKLKVQELLRNERTQLARFNRNPQVQEFAKNIVDVDRSLSRQIGATIRRLHKTRLSELLEQREQANYLKVEIVTGEKELIEGQQGLPPKRIVDVETSVAEGYRFWPFIGEYWEDELGAFVYTTESACVN